MGSTPLISTILLSTVYIHLHTLGHFNLYFLSFTALNSSAAAHGRYPLAGLGDITVLDVTKSPFYAQKGAEAYLFCILVHQIPGTNGLMTS